MELLSKFFTKYHVYDDKFCNQRTLVHFGQEIRFDRLRNFSMTGEQHPVNEFEYKFSILVGYGSMSFCDYRNRKLGDEVVLATCLM